MQPLALTLFWMIGILWAIYYWYCNKSLIRTSDNNVRKVIDFNFDGRHSTSSIESLEQSDNESTRRKNVQKLRYEGYNDKHGEFTQRNEDIIFQVKTRWPSRSSVKKKS